MTLKEYIEQNGNKPIEIQEDGTIRVLEEKGPWKPKNEEFYYTITDAGDMTTLYWDGDSIDNCKLEIGNVFRTEEEVKRIVHRLKARKKFLDAGGHEGIEGYEAIQPSHKLVWKAYPTGVSGEIRTFSKTGVSAFEIWFESEDDAKKAIDNLTEDEVKALCWTGENK